VKSFRQNREDGLNHIGQAYLDVKNGKASVVMLVIRDEEMTVQTAGISTSEACAAVAQANALLVAEMRQALSDLLDIAEDMDKQLKDEQGD